MAAVRFKFFQSMAGINNYLSLKYANGSFPKLYSVFAPDFKEPISDREKIKKILETQPREELLLTRVKPCLNSIPCSVYYDPDVEKLINYILKKGKRELAKGIVRDAFTKIKHLQLRRYNSEVDEEKRKDIIINPYQVFSLAVKNVTPLLGVIKIKRSGSWFKVPVGISESKAKRTAMKWIVECSKDKGTKTALSVQLANELLAAAEYKGKAVNKKIEFHKMCEANRSFVHYWFT